MAQKPEASGIFPHVMFAAILMIVLGLCFFNALRNPFMIDDHNVILWDFRGHNLQFLPDQFVPDYRALRGMKDLSVSQYFRPWAHVLPLVSHHFFLNDPFGYHIVNLVLFYFACLALYAMIFFAFKDIRAAAMCAGLYAIHPVNGLMVNYITASVFSFQLLMTSLGMICAAAFLERTGGRWALLAASLFFFLNALFCHESALVFPFYVTAWAVIIRGRPLVKALKSTWIFWAAAAAYFAFRMSVVSLKTSILGNIFLMDIQPLEYAGAFVKLLAWYFQGLITLQNIVLIKAVVPASSGNVPWILGLLMTAGLIAGLFSRMNRWERFGILWLAVSLLPVTFACFFQYKAGLIIEPHWMAVGSAGFFIVLAGLISRLAHFGNGGLAITLVMILAVWNINVSWAYNRIWGDEVAYCLRWMKESPTIRPIKTYLGHAYLKRNDFENAKRFFMEALSDDFFDYEVFTNLAGIAMQEDRWDLAGEYLKRALTIHPSSAPALNNLGVVYYHNGLENKAEETYLHALEVHPYFMDARKNLAGLYAAQLRWEDAARMYEESLAVDPTRDDLVAGLLQADLALNRRQSLESSVQKLTAVSKNAALLVETAVELTQSGYDAWAVECFTRALQVDPQYRPAYVESGKWMGNRNLFEEAMTIWKEGLKHYPGDEELVRLIDQATALKTKAVAP